MLNSKIQSQLIRTVILVFDAVITEKIDNMVFYKKRAAQYSEHLVWILVDLHVLTHNAYKTVGGYRNIYLDPDSVLGVSPEFSNSQMLLYPFEELMYT